jgi:hypothetical protein
MYGVSTRIMLDAQKLANALVDCMTGEERIPDEPNEYHFHSVRPDFINFFAMSGIKDNPSTAFNPLLVFWGRGDVTVHYDVREVLRRYEDNTQVLALWEGQVRKSQFFPFTVGELRAYLVVHGQYEVPLKED